MGIRRFRRGDLPEVSALIKRTFSEFNRGETTKKGAREYLERMSADNPAMIESYKSGSSYVFSDGGRILGVVRAKGDMVKNLFVDGRHHGKSIGTRLLEKAEKDIWHEGHRMIRIRASMFAVPFYLKRGYKRTTGTRWFHGLKIQPMIKRRVPK
jgi:GNAT superfamily N-acetyltransferase